MKNAALKLKGRPTLTRGLHKSGRKLYVEMTFALVAAGPGGAGVGRRGARRDRARRTRACGESAVERAASTSRRRASSLLA